MSSFDGTLVKNVTNNTTLDNSIIIEDGYSSTPDIQQDKNSYTDDNGDTQRNVLPHVKQKIWLKTTELTEQQKRHIQTVFPSRLTVKLKFWNDEREKYVTTDFYIPDITWAIRKIDKATHARTYAPIEITLISYGEAVT